MSLSLYKVAEPVNDIQNGREYTMSIDVQKSASLIRVSKWRNIKPCDWSSWTWQLQNCITSVRELIELLPMPDRLVQDALIADQYKVSFGMKITPYMLNHLYRLKETGSEDAVQLVKTILPSASEAECALTQTLDGMGEDDTSSHPLISRFYRNRVLLFVSNVCPIYCRYCFRRRKVGGNSKLPISIDQVKEAIDFGIRADPDIDDVVISGGDPLMMSDEYLVELLSHLRSVPHVRIIRLDTKMAASLPQRITPELVSRLGQFHPLYVTLHFAHPSEITDEVHQACTRLANVGIPLGSYIPLLKGVNDRFATLARLFTELIYMRVRPYYLVHNIANRWTNHFTVPLERAFELMEKLQNEVSGLALPTLITYLPGACGKVPLAPQGLTPIKRDHDSWLIRGHDGKPHKYPDIVVEQ